MIKSISILAFVSTFILIVVNAQEKKTSLYLYNERVEVSVPLPPPPLDTLSPESITHFVEKIDTGYMLPYLSALKNYKELNHPDDWLYYQLVREVAQLLSPKAQNYNRYTIYKWWILVHSGFDAKLTYSGPYLMFYVRSDHTVYNIPYREMNGKNYVCLNYHDYGNIDFDRWRFQEISLPVPDTVVPFSYAINHLPELSDTSYTTRKIVYEDGDQHYQFEVKLADHIKSIFKNYPVVDYSLQFNIPFSAVTYKSLIPELKEHIKKMKSKDGVDFLMHFTRYAFLFKTDTEVFGSEKRFSPEQTLLYDYSDCEDRSALFFYLVKEIYNLPMLVLVYPNHVTVAVQFEKPIGNTVVYNGLKYSICEPSPQRYDLQIGEQLPEMKKKQYEIVYAYSPR